MAKVADEMIVAALLENGTVEKAAAACGISARTVYDRMRQDEFNGLYAQAKADILRNAVTKMGNALSKAVDTIAQIMDDKEINPATRLQAAQSILNYYGKYRADSEETERKANLACRTEAEKLFNFEGFGRQLRGY